MIKTVESDEVRKLITAANNYYNGRPTGMTDYDYDLIMNSIKLEFPNFNIFDYVKYDTDSEHAVHPIVIPTFQKVNYDTLKEEVTTDYVLTPKYDGCSIVAYYRNGELFNILTRSNEVEGVVQTEKLKNKVPSTVNPEIRAILFEALTPAHRSAANGLVNSKYKQEEVDKNLFLRPFDCILNTRELGYIDRMNLTGLKYTTLTLQESLTLRGQGDEPKLYIEDWSTDVPVDGIVAYSRTNPSFGRIFKFYMTDAKSSVVTQMHFDQSNDTGFANIVVEFEPVKIGSITVRKAGNPGSWDTVREKKLGIGSQVKIMLTKMTIPYIKENTEYTQEVTPTCPWCGEEYTEFQGKLICSNKDCGFWVDFFMNRYFNILREIKGTEWVDELTVKSKYDLDMLARCELVSQVKFSSLLLTPNYLMYILKPPRLGGKFYESKLFDFKRAIAQEKPKTIFEVVDLLIQVMGTNNQKEYIELIWGILQNILIKLNAVRKERLSK